MPLAALIAVVTTLFALAQAALIALAAHRAVQLRRAARARALAPAPAPDPLPALTVQLPVFNERRVVDRLIAAAGRLEWPRDRFEIQVLDDSTDDTRERVDRAVARLRAQGIDAKVLRRPTRLGYKAGALAEGLSAASGEWIAIFDADFVPPADFLVRLAPHFFEPRVGMVQARWSHLNRDESRLTAAQAVLLDAHFHIEQRSRMAAGLFFGFNGTAGVWRRACIDAAGGWSHDTLTEDLDLSYRAQLAGWHFVYDDSVAAPAELPADMNAFLVQQRRWARGSIQTARKILPRLWRAPVSARQRIEAAAHLLGNVAHGLLLAVSLLLAPVLFLAPPAPRALTLALGLITAAAGVLPVLVFLVAGQRAERRPVGRILGDVAAAMLLGSGLALAGGRAALQGLGGRSGAWERTPKVGLAAERRRGPGYAAARRSGSGEAGLALYFAVVLAASAAAGKYSSLPFLALMAAGLGWVAVASRATHAGPEAAETARPSLRA